jgi:hypothetical protein
MAYSLYDAAVTPCAQQLGALAGIIDKAAQHCATRSGLGPRPSVCRKRTSIEPDAKSCLRPNARNSGLWREAAGSSAITIAVRLSVARDPG